MKRFLSTKLKQRPTWPKKKEDEKKKKEEEKKIEEEEKKKRGRKEEKRGREEVREKEKRRRLDSLNYNLRPFSRPQFFRKNVSITGVISSLKGNTIFWWLEGRNKKTK